MNRKGSLNLSIQAIVIVVIAFVVLGLGLGFVRGQFKSITETSSSVQEQIRQQILEDLRTGNKKLSFPATSLTVEKGGAQDIAIGVKNTKTSGDLKFKIDIKAIGKHGEDNYQGKDVKFFYHPGPYTLALTDAEAYNIKLLGEGNKGTYLVNLKIVEEGADSPYAEKTFFVNLI